MVNGGLKSGKGKVDGSSNFLFDVGLGFSGFCSGKFSPGGRNTGGRKPAYQ
jgi:hypothetical protein